MNLNQTVTSKIEWLCVVPRVFQTDLDIDWQEARHAYKLIMEHRSFTCAVAEENIKSIGSDVF
jgi:hypothetical protein